MISFRIKAPSLAHAAALARTHASERRRLPAAALRVRPWRARGPDSYRAHAYSTGRTSPVLLRPTFFRYPLRQITANMSNTEDTGTVSNQPSWDSSKVLQRAWLDDLLPWLPTKTASCASLVEHGYTLTPQGRVVVFSYKHAQAVFFNIYTPYTMDSPSPTAPTFSFPSAHRFVCACSHRGREGSCDLSGTAGQCGPTAHGNDLEYNRVPCDAPAYRVQYQNSGRTLIRILIAEANASSPSAGLAIESMMESLLLIGLTGASLTEFNALHHAFSRLNRSLPAHAQLGDPLVAESCAP
eukprot:6201778-Pleurochrysis_carterae.AAC.5